MRRPLVAAVTVGVLLAGCSVPGSAATPARPSGPVTGTNPNTPELVAAREAAGIEDCPAPAPEAQPQPYGLPDVTLPCLGSDRSVNLARLRGKPMVVNVWATWCGPCRAEAPFLREFAADAKGKVRVMGIDYTDPYPADALEFARRSGWRYPHLSDPDGVLAHQMQIPGIPLTLLVSADGRVVYRHTGVLRSAGQIEELARDHLGVKL